MLAAKVDAAGISAPSFDEVLLSLQDSYRAIYGADIYLEADSQDGQLLAIFATAIHDCIDSSIAVYNDFSPSTAQGAGLSSVIKVNGITRQVSTQSTVIVTLVGQQGTQIIGGVIADNLNLGTRWQIVDENNQPTTITIPASGEATAKAICLTQGAVTATAHTLTNIMNPQLGWQTADNPVAAVPGAPVETDAMLRRRQSRSASLPANTTLDGIYAAVADVDGVSRAMVYENDHGYTDALNLPAHSIAIVFEGGDPNSVAQAVALKKPPGVQTYGIIHSTVFDELGIPSVINLYPLANIRCSAVVYVQPEPSYVSSTTTYIRQSLAAFYTNLEIKEPSYLTRAYGPANLSTEDAEWGTGLTEPQLDVLADSFHVTEIAQRREDMFALIQHTYGVDYFYWGANYNNFSVGKIVYIQLDDTSKHRAVITVMTPGAQFFYFSPAIPGDRYIPLYAPIFVVGDLIQVEFWVAYYADPVDIEVILPPVNIVTPYQGRPARLMPPALRLPPPS